MGDITEISRKLAERAQAVAEMLLPNGKKDGHEWRVGSISGEPGKSLGIHLSGPKAGVWCDFAKGDGGDLIELWRQVRHLTLTEALDDARRWLGIERPKFHREEKKEFKRPPKPKCKPPRERVQDYLCEDRNLPGEVLEIYKIGERGDMIVFPYLLPDGVLAMAKERKAEPKADPVPTSAGCEAILFGWQAMPENAREVTITEGEIDALSAYAYGRPAFSVPFGGGKGRKQQQWIENEYERLDRFERIYLATDMDKEGNEAAEEIANRLGRHRCLRVKLPRKDLNDCLVDGVSKEEIGKAFAEAENLDPEGLRHPSDYRDRVKHLFWPAEGEHQGYKTPYAKLIDKLRFRPAEVTLWSGDSGAGKSQLLSDCIVDWVKQGSRVCLSSLEMKGDQTLKRMCKQVVGTDRPTAAAIDRALAWLDAGLFLYDEVGKSDVGKMIAVFDYARAKYGCDQFVIDSLMRLGVAGDDYAAQEETIYKLVDWAVGVSVHLHVVAHSRKGSKDRGAPEIEDIKGTMEIGANAFNILTVWRNRKHEDDLRNAVDDEQRSAIDGTPGVVLNVAKQRNGDFEGKIGLWFDQASYRYRSAWDRKVSSREYLEAPPAPILELGDGL